MDLTMGLERGLRGEECEVLHVYKCSEGFWTLGVGRLVDERRGGGITREESAFLLHNDIDRHTDEVFDRLPWARKLDPARQGVLVAMAFQMGINGLLGFKNTLALIQAGNYEGAAKGMLNSKWASQTPERAHRMAEQMRCGAWQFKRGV